MARAPGSRTARGASKSKSGPAALAGAGAFVGDDATKTALDAIAAAREASETEKARDNGGPMLDEDAWKKATTQLIAETIELEALAEKVASVRGRISSIKKVAEKASVDWDVVKLYAKYDARVRKGGMGEVVTEQRRLGSLMRFMDSPLHTQFALFPEEPTDPEAKAKSEAMDAELQGQHAFANGEPFTNNPKQPGTQDHVDWAHGWKQAQTAAARGAVAATPAAEETPAAEGDDGVEDLSQTLPPGDAPVLKH